MTLKPVSNPDPYIASILSAGEAKHRMKRASDAEWARIVWAAVAETSPLSQAADIIRGSRR